MNAPCQHLNAVWDIARQIYRCGDCGAPLGPPERPMRAQQLPPTEAWADKLPADKPKDE